MIRFRRIWSLAGIVICTVFIPEARAQPADSAAELEASQVEAGVVPAKRADGRVEEIVVSARKRDELLEDTPLAVSALGVESLRDNDITRLDEIRSLVPNLNFQQSPAGIDNAAQFRIRGIGTTRIAAAFDPGVGVYVDGVYLPRSVSSIMGVVDVQQVEVLRGPQGTLFGKNSIGGAINVTTVKPQPELEGFFQVRPGNFGLIETRAMINTPISDRISTRFSVGTANFGGYTYNTYRDEETSDRDSVSLLGSIRWEPTDSLTLDLSGNFSRDRTHGLGGSCYFVQSGPLAPPGQEWPDACRKDSAFVYESELLQIADQKSYGVWGVAEWQAGDAWVFDDIALKSITSWRNGGTRFRSDVDGTALPLIKIASIEGGPTDVGPISGWSIMQEGQVNATAWDGRVNLVGGVFGFWETTDQPTTTTGLIAGAVPQSTTTFSRLDNYDWAIFGQGSVDVFDWMSVTLGLRYTTEKKGNDFGIKPVLPVPSAEQSRPSSAKFEAWTPTASLALTLPQDLMGDLPLDHLMGYFTYAQGFRGGGFNAVLTSNLDTLTPFDPETLDSFEVGVKSILFEDRLTLNLAGFLYNYDDIQVTSTEYDESTDSLAQLTRNAAEGTGRGFEAEFRAFPIPGLIANGSVGLLFTEYGSFADAVSDLDGQTIDRAGESFNNSPELQTNLGLMMILPVQKGVPDWLMGYLTPRVDWYYQSSVQFAGPELGPAATQAGYNLLHARLAYSFDSDRAQISLWGRNLTNETYFINAQPLVSTFGHVLRTYGPPRTWGAELSYRFG
jgi:iron complex outermembrane receptor protein